MVMDCCQLEQDCPPTVKREVVEDRDRKSPDRDSSGKQSEARCSREGVARSFVG
jgi:hypothetical protein